jgi:hypothetical protein
MPEPSVSEPDGTMPDGTTPEDAAEVGEAGAEEPGYANRAERRARGKGKGQPPPAQKGHYPGRGGSVQGPRQWGNRRSG